MNYWYVGMGLLAALIVVTGVFAFRMEKKQQEIRKSNPGYSPGYWQGRGMAIGIALGCGVGVALHNIAIGAGLGAALGAALGTASEKKHKDEIRPPTEEERALKRQKMMFVLAMIVVGLLVFVLVYLKNKSLQ